MALEVLFDAKGSCNYYIKYINTMSSRGTSPGILLRKEVKICPGKPENGERESLFLQAPLFYTQMMLTNWCEQQFDPRLFT